MVNKKVQIKEIGPNQFVRVDRKLAIAPNYPHRNHLGDLTGNDIFYDGGVEAKKALVKLMETNEVDLGLVTRNRANSNLRLIGRSTEFGSIQPNGPSMIRIRKATAELIMELFPGETTVELGDL